MDKAVHGEDKTLVVKINYPKIYFRKLRQGMKKFKQFLYWAQTRPIGKSVVSSVLFVPVALVVRLIVDTDDFIKNFPSEFVWAIVFGIGIGVVVFVHSLLFPDKYK